MMKKLMLIAFVVSLLTPAAFAEFGLGVKLGAGQSKSDVEDSAKNLFGNNYTHTPSILLFGVEALYEKAGLFNLGEQHILGAKIGYTAWNSEEAKSGIYKLEVKYYEIPLTLYYKYAPSKWHLGGGFGAAFGKTDDKFDTISKVYPFIAAGAEYRFSKLFGLGLDLRYNISGKFEKSGIVYKNVSGVQGAVAARFYF
ncbi:MAG: porin family protein [Elusimicrobiota bacterium]|nr:porin family protein [Elusimicrobiota bacterium]